jgi:hypothetical protein
MEAVLVIGVRKHLIYHMFVSMYNKKKGLTYVNLCLSDSPFNKIFICFL